MSAVAATSKISDNIAPKYKVLFRTSDLGFWQQVTRGTALWLKGLKQTLQ
jgi:hypothetical protein